MKNSYTYFGVLFLLVLSGSALKGQNCGHLNFGSLIAEMPQTKVADGQLVSYQQDLVKRGKEMVINFQKEIEEHYKKVGADQLTPAARQDEESILQKKEMEIRDFERKISELVSAKREELLEPIIKLAEDAIKQVALENGIEAVLDTSVFNAVLFAVDSKDLMPLVKEKMGLP